MAAHLYGSLLVACLAALLGGNQPLEFVHPREVWQELVGVNERARRFNDAFDLLHALPIGNESWRDYRRVEVALMEWHAELYALHGAVRTGRIDAAHAELLATSLRRERARGLAMYDEDEDGSRGKRRWKKRGYEKRHSAGRDGEEAAAMLAEATPRPAPAMPLRVQAYDASRHASISLAVSGLISHVLIAYGVLWLLSLASRDTKLSWAALAVMVALLPVVWQARQLRSELDDVVEVLRLRQVQLAGVFPSTSKAEMIAQHLILEKIDVICDFWEKQTLGLGLSLAGATRRAPDLDRHGAARDDVGGKWGEARKGRLRDVGVMRPR
eukprot:CAMPEP_0117501320 /NCGR_PEP_ID=MMETSP0784-20121206/23237_1 /TAXON_ID=39447 /ORGANISM="" /LENGTH=326 /DNA_ID=CAMNT_0005296569 /DNA_START=47 /DNA_END=1026 /DNA_ORIENTATION=+